MCLDVAQCQMTVKDLNAYSQGVLDVAVAKTRRGVGHPRGSRAALLRGRQAMYFIGISC